MQSVFVIITKLIASKNYFCKEFFVIILAAIVRKSGVGGVVFLSVMKVFWTFEG